MSRGQRPPPGPPPRLAPGQSIPTRDGTRLRANLYLPARGERFVTVVQLTPYTADSIHRWASRFAHNGFAFLAVNCRGRGGSGGDFHPFRDDGRDGHDAVEWAARQPWSDGRVVMSGGSYAGFTQWATAARRPPHLCAIAPIASVYPGWDFPSPGGVFVTYAIRWLAFVQGASANDNLFGDGEFWKERHREAFEAALPLRQQAEILGAGRAVLDEWLAHPALDAYWRRFTPQAREYSSLRVPVLTVTGHYDGDQPGALRYYAEHLASHRGAARRHDLVIGPWDHPGTREPKRKFMGLGFGRSSVFDMRDFLAQWYRWALGDGPRPALLESRVALYVAGEERWRHAPRLGDLAGAPVEWFPSARDADATALSRAGALAPRRPPSHRARYTRDPLDLREGRIELDRVAGFSGGVQAKAIDATGLVFVSAPLRRETALVGWPTLRAWIRIDRRDADFSFWLEEVRPGGRVITLGRHLLRARFRRSGSRPALVEPGKWERYDLRGHQFVARRLARGSRLRLVFTTPVSAHLDRNPNTGAAKISGALEGALPVGVEIALGGTRACRLRFDASPAKHEIRPRPKR